MKVILAISGCVQRACPVVTPPWGTDGREQYGTQLIYREIVNEMHHSCKKNLFITQ